VAKKKESEPLKLHLGKKGTSIGDGAIKLASMNKHKKRSFKFYRGQGR